MSDEIRMMLVNRSTNDLIAELLMWKGLAAEHLDRIAELEAMVDKLIDAGEVMKQACGDQWGWEDMFDDPEFTDFDDLATGGKEREE
jgi:hypothetical protein